ncbi:hypothetical protein L0F63_003400 [Massospora cicadina]|nr:hypothetical protein L0F63_003400 [Massospora cicadina]
MFTPQPIEAQLKGRDYGVNFDHVASLDGSESALNGSCDSFRTIQEADLGSFFKLNQSSPEAEVDPPHYPAPRPNAMELFKIRTVSEIRPGQMEKLAADASLISDNHQKHEPTQFQVGKKPVYTLFGPSNPIPNYEVVTKGSSSTDKPSINLPTLSKPHTNLKSSKAVAAIPCSSSKPALNSSASSSNLVKQPFKSKLRAEAAPWIPKAAAINPRPEILAVQGSNRQMQSENGVHPESKLRAEAAPRVPSKFTPAQRPKRPSTEHFTARSPSRSDTSSTRESSLISMDFGAPHPFGSGPDDKVCALGVKPHPFTVRLSYDSASPAKPMPANFPDLAPKAEDSRRLSRISNLPSKAQGDGNLKNGKTAGLTPNGSTPIVCEATVVGRRPIPAVQPDKTEKGICFARSAQERFSSREPRRADGPAALKLQRRNIGSEWSSDSEGREESGRLSCEAQTPFSSRQRYQADLARRGLEAKMIDEACLPQSSKPTSIRKGAFSNGSSDRAKLTKEPETSLQEKRVGARPSNHSSTPGLARSDDFEVYIGSFFDSSTSPLEETYPAKGCALSRELVEENDNLSGSGLKAGASWSPTEAHGLTKVSSSQPGREGEADNPWLEPPVAFEQDKWSLWDGNAAASPAKDSLKVHHSTSHLSPLNSAGTASEKLQASSIQVDEFKGWDEPEGFKEEGMIFNGVWKIVQRIGRGSFGEVFMGVNLMDARHPRVAIKCEPMTRSSRLDREKQIYDLLVGCQPIPKLHFYGAVHGQHALVMDLLGPSLKQLRAYSARIRLSAVVDVGIQMVSILEQIHLRNVVYRDVKPDNFLLDLGCGVFSDSEPVVELSLAAREYFFESSTYEPTDELPYFYDLPAASRAAPAVHLVDFGLSDTLRDATKLRDPGTGARKHTGTAKYASLASHRGYVAGPLDDLESVGYVLVDLLNGELPWDKSVKKGVRSQMWHAVERIKRRVKIPALCHHLPEGFVAYFTHVRQAPRDAAPDYDLLRDILRGIYEEQHPLTITQLLSD